MGRSPPKNDVQGKGVLANRQAIAKAHHERVTEPTIGSLLRGKPSEVPVVAEDAMVLDALKVMEERDSGVVAVVSAAGLAGLFSERDFARNALLGNRTPTNTPVTDLMHHPSLHLSLDQTVADGLAAMDEGGLEYAPVFDGEKLVGLVARADLLKAQMAFHERVFHEGELDRKLLFLRGTYSC